MVKPIWAPSGSTNKRAVQFKDPFRESQVCVIQVGGAAVDDGLYLLSVQGSSEVNLQMDINFNNDIFVTVFGDKITELTFRGVALPSMCPAGGPRTQTLSGFYNKYKASAAAALTPVSISYNKGDFVFSGVLVKLQMGPYSQEGGLDAFLFDLTLLGQAGKKEVSP